MAYTSLLSDSRVLPMMADAIGRPVLPASAFGVEALVESIASLILW